MGELPGKTQVVVSSGFYGFLRKALPCNELFTILFPKVQDDSVTSDALRNMTRQSFLLGDVPV